ncbi:MAG: DUF3365 domain-containing protein [Nitrospirae bacterium]|nr:DUF3365 domain-containing protein [Nitrospirota bacterium]
MNPDALNRAKLHLALIAAAALVITMVSLFMNMRESALYDRNLALFAAKSFFQEMVAARKWISAHGGVYVPVTEHFRPNPYLKDPLRDVKTTDGMALTKINPSYMTRLTAEILLSDGGPKVHLTSLNPVRPGNAPDAWERAALERLVGGEKELSEIVMEDGGQYFRYIAPVIADESCLRCHEGEKIGQIRGGISVTFSYAPYIAASSAQNRGHIINHVLFLITALAVVFMTGRGLLVSIRQELEAMAHIRRLEGLLPICSSCKRIRTEDGDPMDQKSWQPMELYIGERSEAVFTHGICPDCMKRLYPDLAMRKRPGT